MSQVPQFFRPNTLCKTGIIVRRESVTEVVSVPDRSVNCTSNGNALQGRSAIAPAVVIPFVASHESRTTCTRSRRNWI